MLVLHSTKVVLQLKWTVHNPTTKLVWENWVVLWVCVPKFIIADWTIWVKRGKEFGCLKQPNKVLFYWDEASFKLLIRVKLSTFKWCSVLKLNFTRLNSPSNFKLLKKFHQTIKTNYCFCAVLEIVHTIIFYKNSTKSNNKS